MEAGWEGNEVNAPGGKNDSAARSVSWLPFRPRDFANPLAFFIALGPPSMRSAAHPRQRGGSSEAGKGDRPQKRGGGASWKPTFTA